MNHIIVNIPKQTLSLIKTNAPTETFSISSATNGLGFEEGSFKTPTGRFKIDEKHGFNAPLNTIFKGRQPQGVWRGEPDQGDLVLSRILWLSGVDPQNKNTKERYIYIHGTNHENLIGSPNSCGCIRMKNEDVIKLYNSVGIGTDVRINNH